MRTTFTLLGAGFAVASIAAQPAPYATASPKAFYGAFAGGGNLLPHARTGGLIQYWQRGDSFRMGQVFISIGVRPMRNLTAASQSQTIEVQMSNTPVTFSTMSATFAANFGPTSTIVFTRKPVMLPPVSAATDPNVPFAFLAHDTPFVFLGPHALVQWDIGSAAGAITTPHTADAYTGAASLHVTPGTGCGGTLTATGNLTYNFSGAIPNSGGSLLLSLDNTRLGGSPLPLQLDFIGLIGCSLGVDPQLVVPVTFDGAGAWFTQLNYPGPDTAVLFAQVLHLTTGGLKTSNVMHSMLGTAGYSNYAYNWLRDGPTAEYGPYTTNRGPVLLFRP